MSPRPSAPVPAVSFPELLPISEKVAEIRRLLRDNQVLVVAGETGSGKSTQLPKICLERCVDNPGMIAHTQPRRIAAREVASRVAAEIGDRLGGVVGYKVRFGERTGPDTRIKVLTDGMLLAELERDPELRTYHTVIVDEAHERSINIDFILGYLKRLLRRRPELRVVITSATIDTARFAEHFTGCPVLEVSGRTWPVETRYRPPEGEEEPLPEAVETAMLELWREGPGDILVFVPGEREIRDITRYLSRKLADDVEILPLFARLSPADQKRIFKPASGRRVVLSTNVAETSLTVPGVRYVIDSGLARVSRYSVTRKVQRLPVEKISRAAADQRKGRCGRMQSGVCIRLYAGQDFDSRPEFTDPEIRRTSLASIVLKMKALKLGELSVFPFVEAPDAKQVRSAIRLLHEIGALDQGEHLTRVGRELARLPVEPRIGRLLIEGARRGCLEEMLVIASRLSVQDPLVYPADAIEKAREHHASFPDASSDIEATIALFGAYREQAASLSRRSLDRWCQSMYLAPSRMREWSDLREQLKALMGDEHRQPDTEVASIEQIAISFLSGFLGHIAALDDRGMWHGSHGKLVSLHPSSRSFRKKPRWLVAAELVDTGKLYARQVLPVRPEWIERVAGTLVRVTHHEPWWDESSGNVMALASGTLFGLRLYSGRRVHFGPLDVAASREVFINQALVPARMQEHFEFARYNRALLDEARRVREKFRRPEMELDEREMFAFFESVLPGEVHSRSTLTKWLSRVPGVQSSLQLPRTLLLEGETAHHDTVYPDTIHSAGASLAVEYRYQPGEGSDGVTVSLPLPLLNQFDTDACVRQIPGWFELQIESLLRTLPKTDRRALHPLGARAGEISVALKTAPGGVMDGLIALLASKYGVRVTQADFELSRIPEFLRLRISLVDSENRAIDSDRDLQSLRIRHRNAASRAFSETVAEGYPRRGLKQWDFGDMPESVMVSGYGTRVQAYPALVDRAEHVDLELIDNPVEAAGTHAQGVRRLARIACRGLLKDIVRGAALSKTGVLYAGLYPAADLIDAFQDAVVESALHILEDTPRSQAVFMERLEAGRGSLAANAARLAVYVRQSVEQGVRVRQLLRRAPDPGLQSLVSTRLVGLIGPGFPSLESLSWLAHVPRFVAALAVRVEKSLENPLSEVENRAKIEPFITRLDNADVSSGDAALGDYVFLLEEYHVSVFAQKLKTSVPVSPKRLDRLWQQVMAGKR